MPLAPALGRLGLPGLGELKVARSTEQVTGQPELHRETLSQKQTKKKNQKNKNKNKNKKSK